MALKWNEDLKDGEIVKIPAKMYPKYAAMIKVQEIVEKMVF
jgi:hypothetical protein